MKTEDLIATLAADTTPPPKTPLAARLGLTALVAAGVSVVILLAWLGLRHDLSTAVGAPSFWMKAGYTGWLTLAGFLAVMRLARPGGRLGAAAWILGLGLISMLGMGGLRLIQAPPSQRMTDWLGHSWNICPARIVIFAVPVFFGLMLVLRRLAPTRLALAGAGAGLLSGAVGATVYGLACNESTAAFVATWYTLGVAACAGIGALLGPRLLRW